MIIYKNYMELTLISNVGITNNRIVRLSNDSLIQVTTFQDKEILASSLITNDYNITSDSTDQIITDLLLKDKHKQIANNILNSIGGII